MHRIPAGGGAIGLGITMLMLSTILGFAAGAFCATRYRVFVLLAVTPLAALLAVYLAETTKSSAVLAASACAVAVNLGYLVAALILARSVGGGGDHPHV